MKPKVGFFLKYKITVFLKLGPWRWDRNQTTKERGKGENGKQLHIDTIIKKAMDSYLPTNWQPKRNAKFSRNIYLPKLNLEEIDNLTN